MAAKSINLTTGDPAFDPQEPVTVNGFVFVPLARALKMLRASPAFEGMPEREWEAMLIGMPAPDFTAKIERAMTIATPVPDWAERGERPPWGQEHMLAPSPPSLRELERMRPGTRYVAPPRPAFAAGYEAPACRVRQEGDEFVCVSCARRWGVDEERPDCANDPVRKD